MITIGGTVAVAAGSILAHTLSANPQSWTEDIFLDVFLIAFAIAMAAVSRYCGDDGAEKPPASPSRPPE